MSDIHIELKNYKLLKDYKESYPNARVLLVTGDNEKGKSSLIRAIIENMTAKSTTPDPVTHGSTEGEKTIQIPDKDGNNCIIHHSFNLENKTGSFYAIDHLGKKISSPNKIRELVGTFEELTIDDFYNLTKTAEGRRKLIRNYIYPLINPKEIERIEDIDKRTSKGGDEFDRRTNINAVVSHLESTLKNFVPSDLEKLLAKEYPKLVEETQRIDKRLLDASSIQSKVLNLNSEKKDLENELDSIPGDIFDYSTEINNEISENESEIEQLQAKIHKLEQRNADLKKRDSNFGNQKANREKEIAERLPVLESEISELLSMSDFDALEAEKAEAKRLETEAFNAKNKVDKYNESFKEIAAKRAEQDKLNETIESLKKQKLDILTNSKLPAGLTIDGDIIKLNDFEFSDKQVSSSSAMLVIAEILCMIMEARIIYIGQRSLFNEERFNMLVEIAEKYGKIPVLEQVIDKQEDVKVITTING